MNLIKTETIRTYALEPGEQARIQVNDGPVLVVEGKGLVDLNG